MDFEALGINMELRFAGACCILLKKMIPSLISNVFQLGRWILYTKRLCFSFSGFMSDLHHSNVFADILPLP